MSDNAWRNSSLPVRLGPFDGNLVILWLLALLPIAIWKIVLAILFTIGFWAVESRGFTLFAALRRARRLIAGRKGRALPDTEYRDYA